MDTKVAMNAKIFALGTAVPPFVINQKELASNLAERLKLDPRSRERLLKIFCNSRIEKRYSVIPDYQNTLLTGDLFSQSFPQNIPGSL